MVEGLFDRTLIETVLLRYVCIKKQNDNIKSNKAKKKWFIGLMKVVSKHGQ